MKIAVQPRTFKNCNLAIGEDQYQSHVSAATFIPSATEVVWKGASEGAVFTDMTRASWKLQLDYAQDWETADALSRYLHEHEGEIVPVEFQPVDGGAAFTAMVIITPGPAGGTVDATMTGSVTLGVQGKPNLPPL